MQTKLLRVLNDHTYTPIGSIASRTADVRIIAATNRNLREMVAAGTMREDFFHRLHVLAIELPPLRWHKEDIPALIEHFCRQYRSSGEPPPHIPPAIVERLCAYDWPGNVRELYNELRRYLSIGEIELAGRIADEESETRSRQMTLAGRSFDEIIAATERDTLIAALTQTNGNKAEAAKLLQMPRSSLFRKIQQYGL